MKTNNDILGLALESFHRSPDIDMNIQLYVDGEQDEDMPVSVFFREWNEMNSIEQMAIEQCRGHILDIGAGAGCHSLELERRGHKVHAIDISPGAVRVMHKLGVRSVSCESLWKKKTRYDTLLLLMNGLGMAGGIDKTRELLIHLKDKLNPGGQILGDTSDIFHLYTGDEGDATIPLEKEYYGQVQFQMSFDGNKGKKFDWIYLHPETLSAIAEQAGLKAEVLLEGPNFHFLMKLTKID